MTDHAKIITNALVSFAQRQTWTGERDVILGDFSGNVIAANAKYPRSVYWHNMPGETHEMGTAVLNSDSNILFEENSAYAGNPPQITIGYPPRSNILTVKGTSASASSLAIQGNMSQREQKDSLFGNPHVYSIVDWRVRPTDTPSTSVYVEAGFYEPINAPGSKVKWPGNTTALSSQISALTSGQHQLAVIYFDRNTAALGVSTITAVSAVGTLPSRSELTDISTVTLGNGQDAKGVVYLYYGQTTIAQSDCMAVLDPRWSVSDHSGEIKLSTTAAVDMNTATATTLYTVPTGRSCIITRVVVRNASTSLTTASYSFGYNSATFNDVIADATHTELTGNTLYTILSAKAGAKLGAATNVFKVLMNTLQGGAATTTMDVFGYLL